MPLEENPSIVPHLKALISGQRFWVWKKHDSTLSHGDLLHIEGTAHIDFSKLETTEAINVKILPVMHM